MFKHKPLMNEKNRSVYITLVSLLSAVSVVPLFMPVVVCFLSSFSQTAGTAENIYYILRGLFGICLIVGASIYAVKKDISAAALPSAVCFIMLLFPLYSSVTEYTNALSVASELSMTVDYTLYIVNIAVYLVFVLLSLFTLLFSIGAFRYSLIVLVLSVIAALSALFLSIDKYVTYQASAYEIICFAYSVVISLIPTFIVLSAKAPSKKEKYIPKRSR